MIRNSRTACLGGTKKEMAQKSGRITDRQRYCKLRNHVTKLNQKKIKRIKNDGKKLRCTLNNIVGRNTSPQHTFIECGGTFIRKPKEIANFLNDL